MAEIDEYKEWLASAPTARGYIDTIEVYQDTWAERIYLVNWDTNLTCRVEDGAAPGNKIFTASRFWLEPSSTGDTTEQSTTLAISSLDGKIYEALNGMSPDDRQAGPITITPRLYWTDDQSEQLINPAPVWELHNVSVSLDVVRGDLQAAPMRVHRVGTYYTALEFPVLRYAR